MSGTLRLALLGCGAIARYHLDGIKERVPRIQVSAAIDTDRAKAEKFAAETGAQVFTSLDEAREKGGFDAVDIMLPHDLHERFALQAFAAGKHVLLEKPMAPTLDGCARILAAAKQAGTVFMVAENAQYWPEIVKAQALIQSGAIGEIITARAAFVCEFDDYWFKEKKPWRYEQARAGGASPLRASDHVSPCHRASLMTWYTICPKQGPDCGGRPTTCHPKGSFVLAALLPPVGSYFKLKITSGRLT